MHDLRWKERLAAGTNAERGGVDPRDAQRTSRAAWRCWRNSTAAMGKYKDEGQTDWAMAPDAQRRLRAGRAGAESTATSCPKGAKVPDAAWLVLQGMTSKEVNRLRAEILWWCPARKSQLGAWTRLLPERGMQYAVPSDAVRPEPSAPCGRRAGTAVTSAVAPIFRRLYEENAVSVTDALQQLERCRRRRARGGRGQTIVPGRTGSRGRAAGSSPRGDVDPRPRTMDAGTRGGNPGSGRRAMRRQPNVVLFISDQQRADTMPGARRPRRRSRRPTWTGWRPGDALPARLLHHADVLAGAGLAALGPVPARHRDGGQPPGPARAPRRCACAPDVRAARPTSCGRWATPAPTPASGTSAPAATGAASRDFATRSAAHDVDGAGGQRDVRFLRRVGAGIGTADAHATIDPDDYDPRTQRRARRCCRWPSTHSTAATRYAAAGFIHADGGRSAAVLPGVLLLRAAPPFVSPRPFDRHVRRRRRCPLPETLRDEAGARAAAPPRPSGSCSPAAQFTDDDLRAMWAAYCGAVSYVDHLVGTLLAALIETDQFDDTLFVFTSDHGEMLGAHGLLLKGAVLYEELVNVPAARSGRPGGLPRPHATARLVSHVDLVPTILRWCGAERAAAAARRGPPGAGRGRRRAGPRGGGAGVPLVRLGRPAGPAARLAHRGLEVRRDDRRRRRALRPARRPAGDPQPGRRPRRAPGRAAACALRSTTGCGPPATPGRPSRCRDASSPGARRSTPAGRSTGTRSGASRSAAMRRRRWHTERADEPSDVRGDRPWRIHRPPPTA